MLELFADLLFWLVHDRSTDPVTGKSEMLPGPVADPQVLGFIGRATRPAETAEDANHKGIADGQQPIADGQVERS